jgi:hypothetical protein
MTFRLAAVIIPCAAVTCYLIIYHSDTLIAIVRLTTEAH